MRPVYVAHGLQADDLAYAGSLAKQVTGACAALLAQRRCPRRRGADRNLAPGAAGLGAGGPRAASPPSHRRAAFHRHRVGVDGEHGRAELDLRRRDRCALDDARPRARPGHRVRLFERRLRLPRADHRASLRPEPRPSRRARLFEPLQMHDTILWSGPQASPPHAALLQPLQPPAPLSVGDGGLWTTVRDLIRWNDALLADTLGITTVLHTPGALDDGTPLDYAWGVRVFRQDGRPGRRATGAAGRGRQPSSCGFRIAMQASRCLRSTTASSG